MLGLGMAWAGFMLGIVANWEKKARTELTRQDAWLDRVRAELLPERRPREASPMFWETFRTLNVVEDISSLMELPVSYYGDDENTLVPRREIWLRDFTLRADELTKLANALEKETWPSGAGSMVISRISNLVIAVAFYEGLTGKTDQAYRRLRAVREKTLALAESRTSADTEIASAVMEASNLAWRGLLRQASTPATAAALREKSAHMLDYVIPAWTAREQLEAMDSAQVREQRTGWPLRALAVCETMGSQKALADWVETGADMSPVYGTNWWQGWWVLKGARNWGSQEQLRAARYAERERRFYAAVYAAILHRAETGAFPASLAAIPGDPLATIARTPARDLSMPVEIYNDGRWWFLHQPLPTDLPATTLPTYSSNDYRRYRKLQQVSPSTRPGVVNQLGKPN